MTRVQLAIGILLCLLFAVSCTQIDADEFATAQIYTIYKVQYNAEKDQTYGEAVFNDTDNFSLRLKLGAGESIRFEGGPMQYSDLWRNYEATRNGFYPELTFEFQNRASDLFTNVVRVNSIGYPEEMVSIEKGEVYRLYWVGKPLGENEYVTLLVQQGGVVFSKTYYVDAPGSSYVEISKEDSGKLTNGKVSLLLERFTFSEAMSHPGAGGLLQGNYFAGFKLIDVK